VFGLGKKKRAAIENTEVTETSVADQLTEKIIAAAIEVHKALGPGLLESIYEEALCHELGLMNVGFQRQVAVDVVYKDCVIQGQRLDLLVENEVVVEVKSLRSLPGIATAQLLSYLKASGLNRGLLMNFGEAQLIKGIKRISL
jgi:GxxExxY protein